MKTGVGFFGLLTIVFIALKLTGFITWSWWLVLMPLIIQAGIIILFLVLFVVVGMSGSTVKRRRFR